MSAQHSRSGDNIVGILLQVAEDALAAGDDAGARRNYETALRVDPKNEIARLGIAELDRQLESVDAEIEGISAILEPAEPAQQLARDRVVRLAVDPATLLAEPMPPTEAFVMSRVFSGTLTVAAIASSGGAIPEAVILLVLSRMFARGIVAYDEED